MSAHIPRKPQLCATCAALESSQRERIGGYASVRAGRARNRGLTHCLISASKKLLGLLGYGVAAVGVAYVAWFLYDEMFDCLWEAGQSIVYTSFALLAAGSALLSVCKDEFTVSSETVYG